jgi:hypothetical protein
MEKLIKLKIKKMFKYIITIVLTIIMLTTINNQVSAAENNYQQFLKTDKNILTKNIKKNQK